MSEEAITARVVPPTAATVPVKAWKDIPNGHAVAHATDTVGPQSIKIAGVRVFENLFGSTPVHDSLHRDHGPAVATIRDGKMTIELVGAKADPRETTYDKLEQGELFRFTVGDRGRVLEKVLDGWVVRRGPGRVGAYEVPLSFERVRPVIRLGRLEVGGAE